NADAAGRRFNLFRVSDGALNDHREYDDNLVRYAFAQHGWEIVVVKLDFGRGGLIAYALDVATNEELWSKVFKLGTRYFRGEEDELVLLEPRGRLAVVRTTDGSILLDD